MLAFLTQRLLQIIPTLILVSMLIFGLQQLLPGDPALIMAGEVVVNGQKALKPGHSVDAASKIAAR